MAKEPYVCIFQFLRLSDLQEDGEFTNAGGAAAAPVTELADVSGGAAASPASS